MGDNSTIVEINEESLNSDALFSSSAISDSGSTKVADSSLMKLLIEDAGISGELKDLLIFLTTKVDSIEGRVNQ